MTTILRPGRNCWTADAAVYQSGLLIDARNYYRAFIQAARAARRYLLIAGWRFNSDVRLLRGQDAERAGEELPFLPFLRNLIAANPELRIYVLAWDFSFNYANEWELFQPAKFQAAGPADRLQFRFDSEHSIGGSHHQKFVVVDGQVVFVGGLDFCYDDYDDRRHLAHNPNRHDPGKEEPHQPYHDMQACLVGPAARDVAGYFVKRWRVATGEALELPDPPPEEPPPLRTSVRVAPGRVALSVCEPASLVEPGHVVQIRPLYEDAIAAADQIIYLENQYFSSRAVFRALTDRLKAADRPRLELVLVLPKRLHSWIESVAMDAPRLPMVEELIATAAEHGHRLGLYYPAATADDGTEVPIYVHSKLMIVDDRFLTVGSANISNRSLGLDTELNVSWEAAGPDDSLVRAIRRVRVNLLAEHCGLYRHPAERRQLRRQRGLVAFLDGLASKKAHCLRPLTPAAIIDDRTWLKTLADWGLSLDPATPALDVALNEAARPASLLGQGVVWFRDWLKGSAAEAAAANREGDGPTGR